jgi:hypothetical protein
MAEPTNKVSNIIEEDDKAAGFNAEREHYLDIIASFEEYSAWMQGGRSFARVHSRSFALVIQIYYKYYPH